MSKETVGEALWHLMGSNVDDLEEVTSGAITRDMPLAELIGLAEEVKRLRRWKVEATEVLKQWDAVSERFDLSGHLGEFTAQAVLEEVKQLQGEQ